jgi:hypothetical protein
MMRLEPVEVKECAKEVGGWEAEAALKVRKEHDVLTGVNYRFDLVARKPAGYPFRNPSRPVKPVNLVFSNVGAHPGSTCDRGRIYTGSLARATGFSVATGIGIHRSGIGGSIGRLPTPATGRRGRGGGRGRFLARHWFRGRKTEIPQLAPARRSTSKRKIKEKGEIKTLSTQDLENEERASKVRLEPT